MLLIGLAALELPPVAVVTALSISSAESAVDVLGFFRLLKAATPPDTNAVAGEVPAIVAQQSKVFASEHKVGSAYIPFANVSPPIANNFTWLLKLE